MIALRCNPRRLAIPIGLFLSIWVSHTFAQVSPAKIPTIRMKPRVGSVTNAVPIPRFKIHSAVGEGESKTNSPTASLPSNADVNSPGLTIFNPFVVSSPDTNIEDVGREGNSRSGVTHSRPTLGPSVALPNQPCSMNTIVKIDGQVVENENTLDSMAGPDRLQELSVNQITASEHSDKSSTSTVRRASREPRDAAAPTELPVVDPEAFTRLRLSAQIQTRAQNMLQKGTSLAHRGALFSAREEFLGVLKLVAQAYDSRLGVRYHTKALANGLRALREADDFVSSAAEATVDVDLRPFIDAHKTPILKDQATEFITPYVAMQHYYDYAREQLALAANRAQLASAALYSIGRVETMLARSGSCRGAIGPKPSAYYQSAVVVDPHNVAAANELGVMLARAGKYQEAHTVLQAAVETRPTKIVVENLARVESMLNGAQLGARYPSPRETTHETLAHRVPVQWVDPLVFNDPQVGPPRAVANTAALTTNTAAPTTNTSAPTPRQWWQQLNRYGLNVANRVRPHRAPTPPVR